MKKYSDERAVESILAKKIYIGMTPDMVIDSWGKPDDVNTTISGAGESEQWIYGSESYVCFEKGVVAFVQK